MQYLLTSVCSLFVLVFGSVPIACFCAQKNNSGVSFEKSAGKLLAFLTCWCFIEVSLAILLACTGLFSNTISVLAHLGLFTVGIFLFLGNGGVLLSLRDNTSNIKISKVTWILIILFSFTSLRFLWNTVIWPTVEIDSLSYHLPLLAKLVQTGKISFLNHYWFQEHYPRHWETLCSLFALPFKNDMFILFPNLLARVVFAVSIVALAVKAGVTAHRAMASSFLICTIPIINGHMETMNVDVPFAAFFLSALYFSLVFSETGSWSYGFLFAMSLSLFMGIKSTGTLYGLLLIVAMVWVRKGRVFQMNKLGGLGWAIAGLFLIPGLFWYVFNLVRFGNPMVGVQISFAGHVLFPGYYDLAHFSNLTLQHVFHPLRNGDIQFLFHEMFWELSFGFLAIAVFAVVFLVDCVVRFKAFIKSPYSPLYFILSCGALLIYYRTPFSGTYNPNVNAMSSFVGQAFRLGFPFIGLVAVLGAVGMQKLKIPDGLLMTLALGIYFISSSNHGIPRLFTSAVMIIVLLWKSDALTRLTNFVIQKRGFFLIVTGFVLPLLLLIAYSPLEVTRNKNRFKRSYGPLVDYVDHNLKNDDVIAFPISEASYIFCGSHFSHSVLYIPFLHSDFPGWVNALRQNNVSIIGIGPSTVGTEYETIRALLAGSPDTFEPLFATAPGMEQALFRLKLRTIDRKLEQTLR